MGKEIFTQKKRTQEVIFRGSPTFPIEFYRTVISNAPTNSLVYPFRWHYQLEIVYVSKGSVMLCRNKEIFSMYCGDFAIINRMELHSYRALSTDACYETLLFPIEVLYFEFFDDCFTNSVRKIAAGELLFPSVISNQEIYTEMQKIINQLFALKSKNDKKDKMQIRLCLYHLVFLFVQHDFLVNNHKHQKKSEEIFILLHSYIMENYMKKISLDEIANHFHFAPQSFCSYFKSYIGMSFVKYLNFYRLDKAYHAILSSDDSITNIALRVGFDSISYFNKKFKEIYHISPGQLRKKSTTADNDPRQQAWKEDENETDFF